MPLCHEVVCSSIPGPAIYLSYALGATLNFACVLKLWIFFLFFFLFFLFSLSFSVAHAAWNTILSRIIQDGLHEQREVNTITSIVIVHKQTPQFHFDNIPVRSTDLGL